MDSSKITNGKPIAAGYAIMALFYFTVGCMLFTVGGWHGLDQAMQNLAITGSTLLMLIGLIALNLLLAIGAWRVQALSFLKQRLMLAISVAIALAFLVHTILVLWRWHDGALPLATGALPVLSGILFTAAYTYSAYSLFRLILDAHLRH